MPSPLPSDMGESRPPDPTAEASPEFPTLAPQPGTVPEEATTPAPLSPETILPPTEPLAVGPGTAAERVRVPGYEVLDVLGRGGMGVVYKARQVRANRVVALKMILHAEHAGACEHERFQIEAESVARLQHPHIVPIYEVGEADGLPFFSLEFCSGGSLADQLDGIPWRPERAAALVAVLARAMHSAHQKGIVHRDLKPANVLLTEDGTPKITDFGLAKRLDGTVHTGSGQIMGTPSYMAPEQAEGKARAAGPAADIYALGAILYELLTGRPPFNAATPLDIILQVLAEEPLAPRLLNPAIPADLEMVIRKCLQKAPESRYPSAEALAHDLDAYLAGEPVSARSVHFVSSLSWVFRATRHAAVLENWGMLWMCHGMALLILCVLTNWLQWSGIQQRVPYLLLWTLGLGTWAVVFWMIRRHGGPVTAIERVLAHLWAGDVATLGMVLILEMMLGLPVLSLAPMFAVAGGAVFLAKAGILSGTFYLQTAALFLTAPLMALWPDAALSILGVVCWACFFFPGLQYHRRGRKRKGSEAAA